MSEMMTLWQFLTVLEKFSRRALFPVPPLYFYHVGEHYLHFDYVDKSLYVLLACSNHHTVLVGQVGHTGVVPKIDINLITHHKICKILSNLI